MNRPLVWYTSGHGFGHASRDIEVIDALRRIRPDLPVVVRTGAERWLFDLTLRAPVDFQPLDCDTGMVQIDSLRIDEAASMRQAAAFYAGFEARVRAEAAHLSALSAALVVGDIPPLAFAAAHRAGIPSVALANFTWDWIYEAYDPDEYGAPDMLRTMRDAYARASLFLRLPLWGGFDMAPPDATRDLPLVARRSTRDPIETRRSLGLPADRTLVLLSFGGHGLEGLMPEALDTFGDEYMAIVAGHPALAAPVRLDHRGVIDLDVQRLYAEGWRYEDLVAAVDVVATKPGYGIIAECAAHGTAVLYTSRGHFVEYEVMVQEMPRFVRSQYIPQDVLRTGRWSAYLEALLAQDRPEPADVTGASVAAEAILGKA